MLRKKNNPSLLSFVLPAGLLKKQLSLFLALFSICHDFSSGSWIDTAATLGEKEALHLLQVQKKVLNHEIETRAENKSGFLCMNLVLPRKWRQWISVSSLLLLILFSVSWWSMEYLITTWHHRHVLQPLLCHSCTVLCSEVLWRPLGSWM